MLRFFYVLLSLTMTAAGAQAANYEGKIVSVFPANGKVYVVVNCGTFDGAPSPCTSQSGMMIYSLDPASSFGRTLFAVALTAKVSERKVYVVGDGVCLPTPYGPQMSAEGMTAADLKG